MHHGPELAIVFIVCFTLVVGAAMSMFSKRIRVPYTVAMLLVGVAVGLAVEQLGAQRPGFPLLGMLNQATAISPELIIFIFLPVLVFESAFSIEVHAFRKNLGAMAVLAGPALLVSTVATAGVVMLLSDGGWGWGWLPALVFGSLISATDPVAVVALLRGIGAPKRLALLIEGESLLNDGTAIVVFGVLVELLTERAQLDVGGAVVHFMWVAGGGALIGLVLAALVSRWLSRTFNAPLIEITLTLMLAYLAMLVAEGLFHVSGVIAVVVAGLWMSGPGRVCISPEVGHFLHHFWGMLSYLANTLIFFLVGLVIAGQLSGVTTMDVVLVVGTYAGVMLVRGAVLFSARPAMNRVAYEVSTSETSAMAWGGLRGAVSLALGLVVYQHPDIPADLRRQMLLLTAGVVLLTIVVNGSTMGSVLRKLGLDKAPAGDRLAQQLTRGWVLDRVRRELDKVTGSRELRTVDWREVTDALEEDRAAVARQADETRDEIADAGPREHAQGVWRQVLSIERAAYWNAFATGTLGTHAVKVLDHEIDLQLDSMALGVDEPPQRRWQPREDWLPEWISQLFGGTATIGRLALRYDLFRGEAIGAERVLERVDSLEGVEPELLAQVKATYRRYLHASKEQLEELRANLPELTVAVETRLAHRIRLNVERETYRKLAGDGAIDPGTLESELTRVEEQMKGLARDKIVPPPPETAEVCRNAELFADLDQAALQRLAVLTIERVLEPDELLFEENSPGDSMFIVARGAVGIYRAVDDEDKLVDIVGSGEVVGEMALLSGDTRNASARALTTLTVGEVSRDDFELLMRDHDGLRCGIWRAFVARRFDNHMRDVPQYRHLGRDGRLRWFAAGRVIDTDADERITLAKDERLFLAAGTVRVGDDDVEAPAWIPDGDNIRTTSGVHGVILPEPVTTATESADGWAPPSLVAAT